jgi:hypothetical protein
VSVVSSDLHGGIIKEAPAPMRKPLGAFMLGVLIGQAPAQVPNGGAEDPRAEVLRKRRQTYPDLAKVVDLAQSVPPEFATDALLRVAADSRNHDRAWKIELLDHSFQMGALAREPNRQKIIGSRAVSRSRAEIISLGFDQRLDRLSLQCRVVSEMLKLDKPKALDMFQRIAWPRLRGLQCRDALIDHVEDYYGLVGEIAESAFTADQRYRGHHVDLLSYQVSRMSAPVEVGAVAKVLSSSTLTRDELNLLASRFAANLDHIERDDRSFSASFGRADQALQELVRSLAAKNVSTGGIIAAYRRYLIRNLTGNRCADSGGEEFSSSVLDSFNQNFASDTDASRAPLMADDVKPAKTQGQADWEPFVNDAEFDRAWQEYLDLWLGKGHGPLLRGGTKPLPDAQKNTMQWRTQFDDFLRQIDDLRPKAGEPEYRHFYRKATGLTVALRVAPPGPDQEKVIRQFVAFLRSSNLQQENVFEWYAQVQRTASSVRGVSPEANARFLGELESSGHPILSLYAVASRVIPEAK